MTRQGTAHTHANHGGIERRTDAELLVAREVAAYNLIADTFRRPRPDAETVRASIMGQDLAHVAAFEAVGDLKGCDAADVRRGGRFNRALRYLCALAPADLSPAELPYWLDGLIGNPAVYPGSCGQEVGDHKVRLSEGEREEDRCASIACAIGAAKPLPGSTIHRIGVMVRAGVKQEDIRVELGLGNRDEISAVSKFVKATLAHGHHLIDTGTFDMGCTA